MASIINCMFIYKIKKPFLKYFVRKTDTTSIQLFRYFISGSTAFLVYIISLFVLTEYFGIFQLVSLLIAYLISCTINFIISKYFVFQNKKKVAQFYKFITIAFIGLLLQFLFVSVETEILHLQYLIANIMAAGIIFLFSFSLNKLITFKEQPYEY